MDSKVWKRERGRDIREWERERSGGGEIVGRGNVV